MNTPEMQAPPQRRERPATARGPLLVGITLSLFVVVPLLVGGLWWLTRNADQATPDNRPHPLVWAERAAWPRSYFTTFKSLERGMMSAARTNETYKDLGFHVSPEEQTAVQRCATLALQDRAAFAAPHTRQALEAELAALPSLFYAQYLLGLWHQLQPPAQRDAAAADEAFAAAFDHAPAALLRRFTLSDAPDAPPAAGVVLDHGLAIAADQVVEDELDRTLVMIYPFLRTDADGFIYLPVYKTILREVELGLPAGLTETLQKPLWFTFFNNVGRMPDTVGP